MRNRQHFQSMALHKEFQMSNNVLCFCDISTESPLTCVCDARLKGQGTKVNSEFYSGGIPQVLIVRWHLWNPYDLPTMTEDPPKY
jgi:hypothetical protein